MAPKFTPSTRYHTLPLPGVPPTLPGVIPEIARPPETLWICAGSGRLAHVTGHFVLQPSTQGEKRGLSRECAHQGPSATPAGRYCMGMNQLQLCQWQAMLLQSFEPRQWFEDGDRPSYLATEGRIMWVFRLTEPGLWTVGFYDPSGEWHPDSDHSSQGEAAARVNYLNGGMVAGESVPVGCGDGGG